MHYENFIILIPALDPDERMIKLIQGLRAQGFYKISLTDDGSTEASQCYFDRAELLGIKVSHHSKRMGKGEALRTALGNADREFGEADFYITADCNGQHSPNDIEKIARKLLKNPNDFVIGVRKFERIKGKKISYWVNYFQRMFFRMTNRGLECPDPRSGLRGFPATLKKLALCTEGKSYDYELNFLDAATQEASLSVVPIDADTFSCNRNSHFRPVVDLLGMYLKFWRYLFTSNIATIFDLVLFAFFKIAFKELGAITIFMATVCARIISGFVGYLLNRYISFRSHLNPGMEMIRYFIVFGAQMIASGILVSLMCFIPIPTVLVKAVVDFFLFFIVYNLQKNWVFAPEKNDNKILLMNK